MAGSDTATTFVSSTMSEQAADAVASAKRRAFLLIGRSGDWGAGVAPACASLVDATERTCEKTSADSWLDILDMG
jgi:hypothetical protein